MPSCWKHCAMSKKRTGKNYKALHEWVDSKKGVNHRVVKHFFTIKLKNYVSKNFGGPEAVSEWLFHIAMDNLDTYITNQWNHDGSEINFCKFGFEDNNYIHYI